MGMLVVLYSQQGNAVRTHSTKLLCLAWLVIFDFSAQSYFGGCIIHMPCSHAL